MPLNSGNIVPGDTIYEEIYGPLRKKVTMGYILGWMIVTLFETMFAIFDTIIHKQSIDYLLNFCLRFILLPSGIDAVIIGVTLFLIKLEKISPRAKNFIILGSLLLVSIVLSSIHGLYVGVFVIFVAPILASSVFLEYKFLVFSGFGSLVGMAISAVIAIFTNDGIVLYSFLSNVIVIALFLALVAIIATIIIMVHTRRELALSQIQRENAKLSKQNRIDGLTGLQNHTSFYNVLENKLEKSRRSKVGFALAVLDIDDFKDVNDTYGHAAGDEILKFVSETLVNIIGKTGVAFRYGGDEFAIIFNKSDSDENVRTLEQIRLTIAANDTMLMNGSGITMSIGYYNVQEAIMSSEEIFYRADQALYQAKYNGKNQVYSAS